MLEIGSSGCPSTASLPPQIPGSLSQSLWAGMAAGVAEGTTPSKAHRNEMIRELRWCSQEDFKGLVNKSPCRQQVL